MQAHNRKAIGKTPAKTCGIVVAPPPFPSRRRHLLQRRRNGPLAAAPAISDLGGASWIECARQGGNRSEERRVGKECRVWGSASGSQKKGLCHGPNRINTPGS